MSCAQDASKPFAVHAISLFQLNEFFFSFAQFITVRVFHQLPDSAQLLPYGFERECAAGRLLVPAVYTGGCGKITVNSLHIFLPAQC